MEKMGELNLWTPPASPPHGADDETAVPERAAAAASSELADFPFFDHLLDGELGSLGEAGRHSPSLSDSGLLPALPGSRKRKALDDGEALDEHDDAFDSVADDDAMLLPTRFGGAPHDIDGDLDDEDSEEHDFLGSGSELSTPAPSPAPAAGASPFQSRSSTPAAKRSRLSRSRLPSGPPAPAAAAAARKALATKSVDVLGELPLPDALQALSVIRGKADGVEVKRISHNILERKRRNDLKTCYNALRSEIPELVDNDRAPTSHILQFAHETIRALQKQDKKLEQQLAAARAEQRRLRARIAAAAAGRR